MRMIPGSRRLASIFLLLAPVYVAAACLARNRAPSSDPAPFTTAMNERTIKLNQPIETRQVRGLILRSQAENRTLPRATIEIRGDGTKGRVKRVTSDDRGRFHFGGLRAGTYEFKVMLYGFQSVSGTILVSKDAPKNSRVNIEMPPAV